MSRRRPGGFTVLLVPGERGGRQVTRCGCCGCRFFVLKTAMWLSDGSVLYGEICPECILRGPREAARQLMKGMADEGESASLRKRNARKLAFLEAMESFPLKSRQAAARELREKR